jgi:hypothetical protein
MDKLKQLIVEIPAELHRDLKVHAAQKQRTVREVVVEALSKLLRSKAKPEPE